MGSHQEKARGSTLQDYRSFIPCVEKREVKAEVSHAAGKTCQVWYSLQVSYVRGFSPEVSLTFLEASSTHT